MKWLPSFNNMLEPIPMSIIALGIMLPLQLVMGLMISEHGMIDAFASWVVVLAMQILYAIANSVTTFSAQYVQQQAIYSLIGFILLSFIGYLLAYMTSPLAIHRLGEIRKLLMIGWVGFITLKTLSMSIKYLMLFIKAKDQDFLNHQ